MHSAVDVYIINVRDHGSDSGEPLAASASPGSSGRPADAVLQEINAGQKFQALQSLRESIPHTMKLRQLHKAERQIQKEGSLHKRNVRRLSKELYQILGIYALILSALVAGVAQTNALTCKAVWGPILITLLVAAAILGSVRDKLQGTSLHQEEARVSQIRHNAIYAQIAQLLLHGAACSLDLLQPHHDHDVHRPAREAAGPFSCLRRLGFSSHRAMVVLKFLIFLPLLVVFSCLRMLCDPPCTC